MKRTVATDLDIDDIIIQILTDGIDNSVDPGGNDDIIIQIYLTVLTTAWILEAMTTSTVTTWEPAMTVKNTHYKKMWEIIKKKHPYS